MAWVPRIVTLAGLVLLAHAGYSAQEHAALSSNLPQQLPSPQASARALPLDIRVETVVATLIVCLGLVLGSPQLRPVRWRVWAGKIEREGAAGFGEGPGSSEKHFRGNPFAALETRSGFVDIRKQRREFTAWAKGNEKQ